MRSISLIVICLLQAAFAVTMSAQEGNYVKVAADRERVKYSPMIFGQFIEHFDTQVYGGIYDPESKFADSDGFRTDVIEALKEIKVPIVRWPGGCFASTYHWLDGVGENRAPVYDKTWQVEDPNTFGTDEFVKWCKKVGAEPFICTNAGTGTPEEMSDWMEYCNLTVGKFARLREKNGHKEPYNVKYWSVGNENWGGHELGAKTVKEWGALVRESSKLMRSVTKDAKLFAAATSDEGWTMPLLESAGYMLDYVSIHGYWDPLYHYNTPGSYLKCIMKSERPEEDIQRSIDILDKAGFGEGRIKIAYDEWNLRNWHHPWHGDFRKGFELETRRKNDIQSTYTMADALFSACFLNACLRHSDIVEIACFSPVVNTRGAIFVHPDGILKRTTFHTLYMFTNMLEEYMVPIEYAAEQMTWDNMETKVLDVVLTSDEKGSRYVFSIINKDPEREIPLKIDFQGLGKPMPKKLSGMVLSGSSPDDYNDFGAENRVVPQQHTFKVKESCVMLPPHSLVMLTVE